MNQKVNLGNCIEILPGGIPSFVRIPIKGSTPPLIISLKYLKLLPVDSEGLNSKKALQKISNES